MLHIPLAYKFVMTAAMLGFINQYAPRLHLPLNTPIEQQKIQHIGVAPAASRPELTFYGGKIVVYNYSFGFSDLSFTLAKLEDDGMQSFGITMEYPREPSNSLMERASRMKYTVNTNDLYAIGTNYLAAMDSDLAVLEKLHPPAVNKDPVFHSNRGLVPAPLLSVHWEQTHFVADDPGAVSYQISAVGGELLELHIGIESTCKGLPLLKEVDKLLAITDEEFLEMSDTERTNLLYRFGNTYLFPPPLSATNQIQINVSTNRIAGTNLPAITP